MSTLAVLGGEKAVKRPFPEWPTRDERDIERLAEVYRSGVWGIGSPVIAEAEEAFARLCGAKWAVSAVNGTTSLWIALKALGVGPGDEVVIPPYTFAATGVAVLLAGAVPVFADIDPETYNLDPAAAEAAVTERTKAIIPVHVGGLPCDMDRLNALAAKHGLKVLEDAAHAHGSEWNGKRAGGLGDVGSFSFQSSKNVTSGEGGMITGDDPELRDLCRSFQNCGRVEGGAWYGHHHVSGNNRLGAFQAALILGGLERAEQELARRDASGRLLDSLLGEIPGVRPMAFDERVGRHARHLYIFRVEAAAKAGATRERFMEALRAEGLPVGGGYVPLYKQPAFQELAGRCPLACGFYGGEMDYRKVSCPVAERAGYEEGYWLPQNVLLGDDMSTREARDEQMRQIASAVSKVVENAPELA